MVPRKSVFFIKVKINFFGIVPNTALSMERDVGPLANVKVLSSTLVKLYFVSIPLLRISL